MSAARDEAIAYTQAAVDEAERLWPFIDGLDETTQRYMKANLRAAFHKGAEWQASQPTEITDAMKHRADEAALSSLMSTDGAGSDRPYVYSHDSDRPFVVVDGNIDMQHLVADILEAALNGER